MSTASPRYASVVFDADSTLASIEGIDWLGALRGDAVGDEIARLTDRAMSGAMPLEAVYAGRLELIRPTRRELDALAEAYVRAIEPGAVELCGRLREGGVRVVIVSGGLRHALLPLARTLGISAGDVHAVDITFDTADRYAGLDGAQPLTLQHGKATVAAHLQLARPAVMIGDGATDAAVRDVVDTFIAYTRVARRETVVAAADAEARGYPALAQLLFENGES